MSFRNSPETVAEMLLDATGTGFPIAPPRHLIPGLDLDGAYHIQLLQERARQVEGREIAGRKVGLTSQAMQQQLGVASPDFGFFTRDLVFDSGTEIPVGRFIAPRVEPELAFILDRDLGAGEDLDSVAGAIRSTHLSIEVIDSRVKEWDITLVDTVADNASGAAVILGPTTDVAVSELPAMRATMFRNGEKAAEGTGADVLGHPLAPLVWLADTLAQRDVVLRAGEIVLTGSFCSAVPVAAGDEISVDYGEYGRLSAIFS